VQEVIESGVNGLLVDYFDAEAQAATIAAVLADPAGHRPLGMAARACVVERYDLSRICLPRQIRLVDAVANGERPRIPEGSQKHPGVDNSLRAGTDLSGSNLAKLLDDPERP
jgi:hypothetical protein